MPVSARFTGSDETRARNAMQAIEFETTAQHQTIQLPKEVPEGVNLRVLILLEDPSSSALATGGSGQESNRPSPRLAGSVTMADDLMQPAVPESDWNALR